MFPKLEINMTEPAMNDANYFKNVLRICRHKYKNMLSQTEVKEQRSSLTHLKSLTKLHC